MSINPIAVDRISQARETDSETLDLSQLGLNEFPNEILELGNLRDLRLHGNHLSMLPAEIGRLIKLETIYLSSNQITSMPRELGKLKKLRVLRAAANKLSDLPDEIGELSELMHLRISGNSITHLPATLENLTNLQVLRLSNNELSEIPQVICELVNLRDLHIDHNHICTVPNEIGRLTELETLDISCNQLLGIPAALGQLSKLQKLFANGNQITEFRQEFASLEKLEILDLAENKLASVSPSIGELVMLKELHLDDNQLASLPHQLGFLDNLRVLTASHNILTHLPREIGKLSNLQRLKLSNNSLVTIPTEIGELGRLRLLLLNANTLERLPKEIGQLKYLEHLSLSNNILEELPAEIGELESLKELNLSGNNLRLLPPEMGKLGKLKRLILHSRRSISPLFKHAVWQYRRPRMWGHTQFLIPGFPGTVSPIPFADLPTNPLESPPPEILSLGTDDILEYLRRLLLDREAGRETRQWISKVLIVGQGGVGKTSLLCRLRDEQFDEQEVTTRGMEVSTLSFPHPSDNTIAMQLNTWDFGGQEIYHATHQFFLTNRSLFILVWNARAGFDDSKVAYWLDIIRARAPESPVIIVACWTDERDADFPINELRQKYGNIVGHFAVSNKTGSGIDALRQAVIQVSANLPLMGEKWPAPWLAAASELRASGDATKYVRPRAMFETMRKHGVSESDHGRLARWLHELGDILWYDSDPDLKDIVILRPQWVTDYISKVLDDDRVPKGQGVLTRELADELWKDLDPTLHDLFLRFMERFDLSYRTLTNPEISIIVERLNYDPPNYGSLWDGITRAPGSREITIRYEINSNFPPGIPTYFIARAHRFTTHNHWRRGALFADRWPNYKHLALVRAVPEDRTLTLAVRGPQPHNFLALLRDGIDLTLDRFPGLPVSLKIPCPGHNDKPCSYEFEYDDLVNAVEEGGDQEPAVQCPRGRKFVPVNQMLLGLHPSTIGQVSHKIDELESAVLGGNNAIMERLEDLTQLAHRQYTQLFRFEQTKIDNRCPSTFVLYPVDQKPWREKASGRKLILHLYCQAPGAWHPTPRRCEERCGEYEIELEPEWMLALGVIGKALTPILRKTIPIVGRAVWASIPLLTGNVSTYFDVASAEAQVALMESVVDTFGVPHGHRYQDYAKIIESGYNENEDGFELRALRELLLKVDSAQVWGGLSQIVTKEGHIFWLCDHHRQMYRH